MVSLVSFSRFGLSWRMHAPVLEFRSQLAADVHALLAPAAPLPSPAPVPREVAPDPPTPVQESVRAQLALPAPAAALAESGNPFSQAWNNSILACAIASKEALSDMREWLQYHR